MDKLNNVLKLSEVELQLKVLIKFKFVAKIN